MRNVQLLQDEFSLLIRLLCLVLALVLVPRLFMSLIRVERPSDGAAGLAFNLGIENISDEFLQSLCPGKKSYSVGLVTNHAAVDQLGNRNIDLLLARGVNIKKIIAPQHGYFGDIASGKPIGKLLDKKTKIPIISLHDRQLERTDIEQVDVIFFDLQDVGIQHYNYVQTLLRVMKIAAAGKKTVVVLDRPNLLGNGIEGALATSANTSNMAVPMRYGMTIGELARFYYNHLYAEKLTLHVVPMANYHRQDVSYLPIIGKLSPNIASLAACQGYSFLGLMGEVAPFDIGVGTDKAFQCLLLPERLHFKKQKWYELGSVLNKLGIESAYYRCYSARKKDHCSGLRLMVRDVNNFSLFKVLVTTLNFFKQEGVKLGYSDHFEKLPGMIRVKELVEGNVKQADFDAELRNSLKTFFATAAGSFLYYPLPKVVS